MATQGTVAITNGTSWVRYKVVSGSDGHNARALAEAVAEEEFADLTCDRIAEIAKQVGLGSCGSLVVMGIDGELAGDFEEDELGPLYRLTFCNPWFNPRWEHGTADYSLCVDPVKGAIHEFVDPRYASPLTIEDHLAREEVDQ